MICRMESPVARHPLRVPLFCVLGLAILFCIASPAAAQKNKNKQKDTGETILAPTPLPDAEAIDLLISEMLGAWQIGDTDRLHKAHAEDVVFVSGDWGPPVVGWGKYLEIYQKQKARLQEVRMDRLNTYIKSYGNVAWANYQWDFVGTVDGQPMNSRGQTSLVLEKREGHWLIVHNHTSLAFQAQHTSPAVPASTAPPESQPPSR
jgi:ketosteroid isomerase-like protein